MNKKEPRLAAISDRARLARLTRAELERLLVRAKRAFEAFGTSAGRVEEAESDAADEHGARYAAKRPVRSAPVTA
jgi:hypothetical protein